MKKFALLGAVALVLAVGGMAEAGRLRGPGMDTFRAKAFGSVWYTETFRGGENARVAIVGDGDTDLDLFVYDAAGNLVARAIGTSDREVVQFYVPVTGSYRIEVRNLGNVWNQFSMATN